MPKLEPLSKETVKDSLYNGLYRPQHNIDATGWFEDMFTEFYERSYLLLLQNITKGNKEEMQDIHRQVCERFQ